MKLAFRILDGELAYTGAELRSGWASAHTGLSGAVAAGFVGPCDVPTANLVDMDDARAGLFIRARRMAHAIIEHPDCTLETAVLRQRLLVCILAELLGARGKAVRRDGDDLFWNERKLTVSIAAPGPAGCLIHLGINVDPSGAPVPAAGLDEMGLDARELLTALFERYAAELETAAHAVSKVREVA